MPTGARAFADVNGTRLRYELSGQGSPIVFVHGFTLDHRCWDAQAAWFARRRLVLRYDERGFGESAMPSDAPYTHADDLAALLANLDLGAAHVVALSIGAMHALEFALEHPAQVRSLVLVDAAGLESVGFPAEVRDTFARIRSEVSAHGVDAGKLVWRSAAWFASARENAAVAALLDAQLATYSGWHWGHANPQRSPSPPLHERLDAVAVPTLVVVGERDLPYNHDVAQRLASGIAGAKRSVIAGAGHLPNMEAPRAFNEIVETFLDGVERSEQSWTAPSEPALAAPGVEHGGEDE